MSTIISALLFRSSRSHNVHNFYFSIVVVLQLWLLLTSFSNEFQYLFIIDKQPKSVCFLMSHLSIMICYTKLHAKSCGNCGLYRALVVVVLSAAFIIFVVHSRKKRVPKWDLIIDDLFLENNHRIYSPISMQFFFRILSLCSIHAGIQSEPRKQTKNR